MSYTDIATVKAYQGITEATDDALLTRCLAAAVAFVEGPEGARRRFAVDAPTTRRFDACNDVDGRRLFVDADLAEIVSVTNGDGETVTSSTYVTEPRNQGPYWALTLKSSSSVTWTWADEPEDAISINGYWGYSRTPPADIVQAVIRLTLWLYNLKDQIATEGQPAFGEHGVVIVRAKIPQDILIIIDAYKALV